MWAFVVIAFVTKARGACCRGFWNRHKDQFPLGQVAQRLNAVVFVAKAKGELDA